MNNFRITVVILVFLFSSNPFCLAANNEQQEIKDVNEYYKIKIDKETIIKGYTVASFNSNIKLSLVPETLNEATEVEVINLNEPLKLPWQVNKISPVYQFEFKNKMAYNNHKPFYIQVSYDELNNNYKQVFFYDKRKR